MWYFEDLNLFSFGSCSSLLSWAPFFSGCPPAFQIALPHRFLHLPLSHRHFLGFCLTLLSSFSESCPSSSLSCLSVSNHSLWADASRSALSRAKDLVTRIWPGFFYLKHLRTEWSSFSELSLVLNDGDRDIIWILLSVHDWLVTKSCYLASQIALKPVLSSACLFFLSECSSLPAGPVLQLPDQSPSFTFAAFNPPSLHAVPRVICAYVAEISDVFPLVAGWSPNSFAHDYKALHVVFLTLTLTLPALCSRHSKPFLLGTHWFHAFVPLFWGEGGSGMLYFYLHSSFTCCIPVSAYLSICSSPIYSPICHPFIHHPSSVQQILAEQLLYSRACCSSYLTIPGHTFYLQKN